MKDKSNKVARFIDTKIVPSGIIPSLLIFTSGAVLFCVFINDKKTSGFPILILAGVCYILLGIGIYGIFRWIGIRALLLIVLFFRLILKGQVLVTIDKQGLHSKLYYK